MVVNNTYGYTEYYKLISKIKRYLKERNKPYIHIAKGDVDRKAYPVQKNLIDIMKKSIDKQYFKYSQPLGRKDTRDILAFYHNLRCGKDIYSYKNISLLLTFSSGLDGIVRILKRNFNLKKALVATPTYVNNIDVFVENDINIKTFSTSRGNEFNPLYSDIVNNIDKDTKLLILCNPNFPFGRYINKNEFKKIVNLCEENNIYLVLDNAYSDMEFSKGIQTKYDLSDITSEYLIRIYSYSKRLGLPGLRLGYLIANEEIIEGLSKHFEVLHGCSQTVFEPLIDYDTLLSILDRYGMQRFIEAKNLISESEKMIILNRCEYDVKEYIGSLRNNLKMYKQNYVMIKNVFSSDSRMYDLIEPQGGFNIGFGLKTNRTSMDIFKEVLLNTGVAITPQEVFQMKDSHDKSWFRITLANDPVKLSLAVSKLHKYFSKL